ncbi:MAG: metallophosphoesterase [Planctomycetes bacterium]|nr:metallophosphoesterase [Planctomycetota bacterium]
MTDSTGAGPRTRLTRRRFIAGLAAGAGAVASGGYYFLSNSLETVHVSLPMPGLVRPFTAVLLADIHLPDAPVSLDELAGVVAALAPDVVFSVGDAYSRREVHLEAFARFLESLKPPLGAFAVPGNWEHQTLTSLPMLHGALKRSGTMLLWNSSAVITPGGQPVAVVGLDDFLAGSPDYKLLWQVPAGRPLVVLQHCPAAFDKVRAAARRPLVQLSGHTHGGQVTPFGIVFYTPPGSGSYVSGRYDSGNAVLYVNRGIGYTGFNARLGARPELTRITFVPQVL